MEEHFERVLSAEAAPKRSLSSTLPSPAVKRTRLSVSNAAQIKAIVDGAEAQEGDAIDARALKSMTNSLTKCIRRNALAREKHADEPTKFLDSELALDSELTRWKQVAAKPEVFSVMMELQVPRVLLGLLTHDNFDIRLAVLALLAEFTDVDDAAASLEPARMLVKHLVDEKVVPLLVTNLYQLEATLRRKEEAQMDEETTGIYHSFQILENMADLEPEVCIQIAKTSIFPFLLNQVAPAMKFTENKLYASEILSILLQSGAESRATFVSWIEKGWPSEELEKKNKKVNLMDDLLQALAPYRKKDPSSEEEEEFASNLVNVLCSVLLIPEAQNQFRRLEGLELLLRFLMDRKRFIFSSALRAMDHTLMGNARNCERLIEIGGLRCLFSAFMGRYGKYKASYNTKASKVRDRTKEEENTISIVASLCAWVSENAPVDGFERLHAKFVENDMEKMDRLVDLFVKYHKRVERSTQNEDGEEDEEGRYLRRLDAGLFVLERTAFVIAHLCRFSKKLQAYVMVKFHERSVDSESLTIVLREQLDLLVADDAIKQEAEQDILKEVKDIVNTKAKEAQITQLRQLLENLQADTLPTVYGNEDPVETVKPSQLIDGTLEEGDNSKSGVLLSS
ncbi:Uncharacterized conserved protein [Plasmopara halstedii]|uniref:Uncharacterized conserved protein n=1 Tax=Plasmopara halstedii TaxID=4781 RepID=A0A0P1API1_PLAHL|nr:Uncharacterized conserved protein [Plasmopara halstedii]CEG42714.1 Uncharacterized conserved protein [Plasmopara halstedii]|eukprot:XP_024579083.1 Uncharacterized conserved protein [Plasmopara halstedii]